mmetsp:Transcript_23204/g.41059  ORF Transcript_23204/g.41059 Transcript_23204/m.41059 type:complete len:219 (-) Transcript_23204:153-809(-)
MSTRDNICKVLPCELGRSRKRDSLLQSVRSGSICQRLGTRLWVQNVEAHEHRRAFCWWHRALVPEAQESPQGRAQLAVFHGRRELRAALDAELLDLVGKDWATIGLRCRHTATQAEDVVDPEGVAKIRRPIEELLPTPSIRTSKFLVEAHAQRGTLGWWEAALLVDAQAHVHLGAEWVADICHLALAVDADLNRLTSKEGVPHCTNAAALAEAVVAPP